MHGDVTSTLEQVIRGIHDASAPADRGRHGRTGHTQLRKRAGAEDEQRTKHDVERIGEPEHPASRRPHRPPREAALMTNSMNTLALPPSMTRANPVPSAITSGPAPMTRSRSGASTPQRT